MSSKPVDKRANGGASKQASRNESDEGVDYEKGKKKSLGETVT
jgi:hypothetical protein